MAIGDTRTVNHSHNQLYGFVLAQPQLASRAAQPQPAASDVYSATRNFLNLTCHQKKNNVSYIFHNRKLGRDSAEPSGPSGDGTEKSGGGA
uniref:Uncharacterized protein n=1 Tax=Oryza nivara TaxID=4536 RepID=A0A0E0GXT5_ORYNI